MQKAALLAAAICGLLVGVATVATGAIATEIGPVTIAFIRYLIGVLILLPFALRIRWNPIPRHDLMKIGLFGVFQFALLIVLLNFAVIHITAGLAVLIFASLPLQTMTLALLLRRESFTLRKLSGILLTIIGVGFTVGATAFAGKLDAAGWIGVGAAFLSAFLGALCSVLYGTSLARYPALQIGTLSMASAVIFLFGLALLEGQITAFMSFSGTAWLILLLIGGASAFGYFCWLFALSRIPASNVTVFLGLSPVTAAILGAIFIAQPLSTRDIIGTCLVLCGLVLSLWHKRDAR